MFGHQANLHSWGIKVCISILILLGCVAVLTAGASPEPIHEAEDHGNLAIIGRGDWLHYVSFSQDVPDLDPRGVQWNIYVDIPAIIMAFYPGRDIQTGEVHVSSAQGHEGNAGGRTVIADVLDVSIRFDMTFVLRAAQSRDLQWKIKLSANVESSLWDDDAPNSALEA